LWAWFLAALTPQLAMILFMIILGIYLFLQDGNEQ